MCEVNAVTDVYWQVLFCVFRAIFLLVDPFNMRAIMPHFLQVPHFFFFTLVTGPRRSLSLELSDARVYEP